MLCRGMLYRAMLCHGMLCGAICAATTQAQVPGFWNECYVVDSRFNTQPNSLENDAANVVHGSVVLHTHTA